VVTVATTPVPGPDAGQEHVVVAVGRDAAEEVLAVGRVTVDRDLEDLVAAGVLLDRVAVVVPRRLGRHHAVADGDGAALPVDADRLAIVVPDAAVVRVVPEQVGAVLDVRDEQSREAHESESGPLQGSRPPPV